MEQLPSLLLCAVIGYLLGSVSAGILYSHLLGSDIAAHLRHERGHHYVYL